MIAHDGADACWWIIAWWADESMFFTNYFTAPWDTPDRADEVETGAITCVWEMVPLAYKCESWARNVLDAKQPSYETWPRDAFDTSG